MCRAPTVLSADRCRLPLPLFLFAKADRPVFPFRHAANVDWALLNFMKDWFPVEARKKLQQNEREAAEEELRELGLEYRGCIVM